MYRIPRQNRSNGLPQLAASLLCVSIAVALPAVAGDGDKLSQTHSLGGMGLAGGAMLGGFKVEPKWSLSADTVDLGHGAALDSNTYPNPNPYDVGDGSLYALRGVRLSGTGTLPINQGLSLYGKLGVANLSNTGSGAGLFMSGSQSVDLSYSAGGQYIFSTGLSLHAEWDRYTDSQGGIDLFSAGLHYNFK